MSSYTLFEAGERQKTLEQQKKYLKALLLNPLSIGLVAELDEELGGYLFVIGESPRKKRHSRFMAMGVIKNHQEKGFGTLLLREAIKYCNENGVMRLELTVVHENDAAISLYKKHGFVIEGIKKNSCYFPISDVNPAHYQVFLFCKVCSLQRHD